MDPSLGLLAGSVLASFLLKTTAEWLVCLLLVRVAGSAKTRFKIWLVLIFALVAQWLWMGTGLVRMALQSGSASGPEARGVVGTGDAIGAGARVAVGSAMAGNIAQAMALLLACYGLVLAWRMMGAAAAQVRLTRAMHHRTVPAERLANSFREALEQITADGRRLRDCELWVLPGLASPATLGWWQPRVIVPPICEMQDAAELQAVFWHELKHVERRDGLWNTLVRGCGNLLWFHPCVHHAIAALNAERELACDAAVVREHPQSRDVYATCLVRFARYRELASAETAGIEMASGAALLSTRVRSILGETERMSRISQAWRVAASAILLAGMAATVPALHVLFAAEGGASAVELPMAVATPVAAQSHGLRSSGMRIKAQPSNLLAASVGVVPSVRAAGALPHDEGLAAEHRAAMDIVSESTGMDAPSVGNEGRISRGVSGTGQAHGPTRQSSPAWTSVAVDAAQRMGPL